MTIRTVLFDPIKVEVDGVESPILESSYQDEDGVNRKVTYVVVNGEKVPIQHQADLMVHLAGSKLDQALVKVEEARKKKEEDPKKDKKDQENKVITF